MSTKIKVLLSLIIVTLFTFPVISTSSASEISTSFMSTVEAKISGSTSSNNGNLFFTGSNVVFEFEASSSDVKAVKIQVKTSFIPAYYTVEFDENNKCSITLSEIASHPQIEYENYHHIVFWGINRNGIQNTEYGRTFKLGGQTIGNPIKVDAFFPTVQSWEWKWGIMGWRETQLKVTVNDFQEGSAWHPVSGIQYLQLYVNGEQVENIQFSEQTRGTVKVFTLTDGLIELIKYNGFEIRTKDYAHNEIVTLPVSASQLPEQPQSKPALTALPSCLAHPFIQRLLERFPLLAQLLG